MGEVQIRINAKGAAEAEADLRSVAAGEKAVGDGARAAAKPLADDKAAKAAGAQASRELDERNRTLAERFRALGPEAALVGDAIDSLSLKQGASAMAVGALGVAILGITMLYQKWNEYSEQQRQKAQALIDDITKQAQAYDGLAESINAALAARLAESGAAEPAEQAPALLRRVAAAAEGVPIGEAGIKAVAAAAAAAPKPLSDVELEYFNQYQAVYGHLYSGPAELLENFMGFMQQANATRTLDAVTQKRIDADRVTFQRQQTEQQELARRVSPPVLAARGLEDIARRETAAGRPMDVKELHKILEDSAKATENSRQVEALFDRYREIFDRAADAGGFAGTSSHVDVMVQFAMAKRRGVALAPEDVLPGGRGLLGATKDQRAAQGRADDGGAGAAPGRADDGGAGAAPGRAAGRLVQYVFSGTNYINMDKTDPAGVPVPTGME